MLGSTFVVGKCRLPNQFKKHGYSTQFFLTLRCSRTFLRQLPAFHIRPPMQNLADRLRLDGRTTPVPVDRVTHRAHGVEADCVGSAEAG